MTTTTEIPLNKLVPFAGNVRKTHNKRFIAEHGDNRRALFITTSTHTLTKKKQVEICCPNMESDFCRTCTTPIETLKW